MPFPGHRLPPKPAVDSRRPGAVSGWMSRLGQSLRPPEHRHRPAALPAPAPEPAEPERDDYSEDDGECVEMAVAFKKDAVISAEAMALFWASAARPSDPIALEIVATSTEVIFQIAARPRDADGVQRQLRAHFPDAKISRTEGLLREAWLDDDDDERVIVDFGLSHEFMRPLEAYGRIDPFVSLVGSVGQLALGEVAVYQALAVPLEAPWAENALAAVVRENGRPFFDDAPELVKEAQTKVSRPLFGVVLRLASRAESLRRAWDIVREMSPALRAFSRERGQALLPLSSDDYPLISHIDDLWLRRSRRCGMILNLDELVGLAHWPSPAVTSPKLARLVDDRSRAAPAPTQDEAGESLVLGYNVHDGVSSPVHLSEQQRLQHMHCIGATGTGKSSLLLSLILQDLKRSRGFAILDPHGDLIDRVLAEVPSDRLADVVLIDPSDEQFVTPFNVLSAHSDYEKTLLASDLVSVFRRLSTSWGDRMNIIFQNLVLAFLEHPDGGTLADMRRFLVDADWRRSFIEGVSDPDVQFYWEQTFPKLDGPKSVGPILTRLEVLLTPKIIRYMVSQRENRIDFSRIMDGRQILLARLPMGQIGKEVTYMLGSLIMVKLQQMAMGRARVPARQRTPFFCYVDECQHFVAPSMAEILGGARKYGLGLILAHQDLHQLSASGDVAAAVMTNAATRIVFRVSETDGRALKGDFAHYEPKDFAELPTFHAIARIGRADQDFNLRVQRPEDIDPDEAAENRQRAIDESRRRYTMPRAEVEAQLRAKLAADAGKGSRPPTKIAPQPPPSAERFAPAQTETADEKLGTSQVPAAGAEIADAAGEAAAPASESKSRTTGQGVGGQDHRAAVARLAEAAKRSGFWVRSEYDLPDRQRVDLAVGNSQRRIAFEVAMTENTGHELDNLKKCVRAGFDHVASVSTQEAIIVNLRRAVAAEIHSGGFSPDEAAKVVCLSVADAESWMAQLAEIDAEAGAASSVCPTAEKPPEEPATKVIAGRRVQVRRAVASPQERQRAEADNLAAIAEIIVKKTAQKP